jgi:hypothetical protein
MTQDKIEQGFERLAKVEESLEVCHKRVTFREEEHIKLVDRITSNEGKYMPAVKNANFAQEQVIDLRNNLEKFAEKITNTVEAIHKRQDAQDATLAEIANGLHNLTSTMNLKDIEEAKQRGVNETLEKLAKEKKAFLTKMFFTFGGSALFLLAFSMWWVYSSIHELKEHKIVNKAIVSHSKNYDDKSKEEEDE